MSRFRELAPGLVAGRYMLFAHGEPDALVAWLWKQRDSRRVVSLWDTDPWVRFSAPTPSALSPSVLAVDRPLHAFEGESVTALFADPPASGYPGSLVVRHERRVVCEPAVVERSPGLAAIRVGPLSTGRYTLALLDHTVRLEVVPRPAGPGVAVEALAGAVEPDASDPPRPRWLSRLGPCHRLSRDPASGSRPWRDRHVVQDGHAGAPLELSDPIGRECRFRALRTIEQFSTVVIPAQGSPVPAFHHRLAEGQELALPLAPPVCLVAFGGLVDGEPWEDTATMLVPPAVELSLRGPARVTPGARFAIEIEQRGGKRAGYTLFTASTAPPPVPADPVAMLTAGLEAWIDGAARLADDVLAHQRPLVHYGATLAAAGKVPTGTLPDVLRARPYAAVSVTDAIAAAGGMSEDEAADFVAAHMGVERVRLTPSTLDQDATRTLARQTARNFGVVPWRIDGDQVVLAIAAPPRRDHERFLPQNFAVPPRFVIASASDLRRAHRSLPDDWWAPARREGRRPPPPDVGPDETIDVAIRRFLDHAIFSANHAGHWEICTVLHQDALGVSDQIRGGTAGFTFTTPHAAEIWKRLAEQARTREVVDHVLDGRVPYRLRARVHLAATADVLVLTLPDSPARPEARPAEAVAGTPLAVPCAVRLPPALTQRVELVAPPSGPLILRACTIVHDDWSPASLTLEVGPERSDP